MLKCKWCGRHYKEGTGVGDGLLGIGGGYCSERCREEDRRARSEGGGTKKFRWVWELAIILILLFLFYK